MKYHIPASLTRGGELVTPHPDGVELSATELELMEKHHGPSESWPKPGDDEQAAAKPKAAPLPGPTKAKGGKADGK